MKRMALFIAAVVVMVSLVSAAIAAEMKKGTIKAVDHKAGTITFCPEGTSTDMTLKADKNVNLHSVKPDTKAEIKVEGDTVKEIKEMKKPKAAVGC